jgi:F-type H+-transporting ATPase subunit gamma
MGGLKEVRERITSVSSTRQITSAMKMVSAAKLRRAQDAVTRMRPYASKLKEILENLSATIEASEGGAYSVEREVKTVLMVVISSNRGLCGGFNANISKAVLKAIASDFEGKEIKVIAIGKKAGEFMKRRGFDVIESYNDVFENLSYELIAPIAEQIMQGYTNGTYDRVEIFYNQFVNAASQLTIREQYLPVAPPQVVTKATTDYIFEPEKVEIVLDLIPRSLKTQLYKGVLDSHASEHGARMTAMHKATDNAGALVKELKLNYNKARQAAITGEILEIVAGAESLKG